MSPPAESAGDRDWKIIARNLDAESRRLDEIDRDIDRLLAGGDLEGEVESAEPPAGSEYEVLTRLNDQWRRRHGDPEVDLWNALGEQQRREWDHWKSNARLAWTVNDLLAVGLAGAVGALASLFDDQLDQAMRGGLESLRQTDLLQGWERAAKRMPIDYTGPKFGGPGHRVRSSGHDPARVFSALSQIRNGQFRGVVWEDGVRTVFTTPAGSYVPIEALSEALLLWAKHLAADFVTPMSLPLPGWTFLYELESRDLRKFAHSMYDGTRTHPGLNLRSGGLTPMLGVLSTETVIRTHVHAAAWQSRRKLQLTAPEQAKRTELLLGAHTISLAASIGCSLAAAFGGEGPLGLRHLNVPLLLRVGHLGWQARKDAITRREFEPPGWRDLLSLTATPALLDEDARTLDRNLTAAS